MLNVSPIRYVADVEATRSFYAGLGLHFREQGSFGDIFVQLAADAGSLGIHDAAASKGRAPGTVELNIVTDEDLALVAARLESLGYTAPLHEEDFGRSIRLLDPDGVSVQIQEIRPDVARASLAALS